MALPDEGKRQRFSRLISVLSFWSREYPPGTVPLSVGTTVYQVRFMVHVLFFHLGAVFPLFRAQMLDARETILTSN